MAKYKTFYLEMVETHQNLFTKFREIHDLYRQEPEKYQVEYNSQGAKIVEIIRDWENRLCAKTENARYGAYSPKLSEKFWAIIRAEFPKIDFVGVK